MEQRDYLIILYDYYGELELKFMGYCRYKINNDGSVVESY